MYRLAGWTLVKKCVCTVVLAVKSIKIKINLRADWNTNEKSEFAAIIREIEIGVICCDNACLRRYFSNFIP